MTEIKKNIKIVRDHKVPELYYVLFSHIMFSYIP